MKQRVIVWLVLMGAALAAAAAVTVVLSRYLASGTEPQPTEAAPAAATRKIQARLFYVGEDGIHLHAADREVPFGEGTLEQARRLIEAQLEQPQPPALSAIPPGTRLRAVYLSATNEAFVDLSAEARSAHPGGITNEMLTVYSIVNALTVNLPALAGVQILVDGREVDTLAGHVDLRRPLRRSALWSEESAPPQATPGPAVPRPDPTR